MKNTIKTTAILILALACIFCTVACKSKNTNGKTDLWENAIYLEDTEFGEGGNKVVVEVKAADKSVTFTVNTNKTTVGAALLEHGLIAGDQGEFGIYIKSVNGIIADYDINQSYWAFYIDGEYAMTGVDTTEITQDAAYLLEYTK